MLINREQQRVIDEVEQNILLLASLGREKQIHLLIGWLISSRVAMRRRRISCA